MQKDKKTISAKTIDRTDEYLQQLEKLSNLIGDNIYQLVDLSHPNLINTSNFIPVDIPQSPIKVINTSVPPEHNLKQPISPIYNHAVLTNYNYDFMNSEFLSIEDKQKILEDSIQRLKI